MPEFSGHPFLFDLEMPQLTTSPGDVASTHKSSSYDFGTDLSAVPDIDLFDDQGLDIWSAVEESEGVLRRSFLVDGNLEGGTGASTVFETDCRGGMDAEKEEKRGPEEPKSELV